MSCRCLVFCSWYFGGCLFDCFCIFIFFSSQSFCTRVTKSDIFFFFFLYKILQARSKSNCMNLSGSSDYPKNKNSILKNNKVVVTEQYNNIAFYFSSSFISSLYLNNSKIKERENKCQIVRGFVW